MAATALTPAGATAKYTSGLFADNPNRDIGADDISAFEQDIWASFKRVNATLTELTLVSEINDNLKLQIDDVNFASLGLIRQKIREGVQKKRSAITTLTSALSGMVFVNVTNETNSYTLPNLSTVAGEAASDYVFYHFAYIPTSGSDTGYMRIFRQGSDVIESDGITQLDSADHTYHSSITLLGITSENRWVIVGARGAWECRTGATLTKTLNFGAGGGTGGGVSWDLDTDTTLDFTQNYTKGTAGAPITSNITVLLTSAINGAQGVIYHQAATAPTFAGVTTSVIGTNTYVANGLNIILYLYNGAELLIGFQPLNAIPTGSITDITGTKSEGSVQTLIRSYNDTDGDLEDAANSVIKVYYADDTIGTNAVLEETLTGTTQHTIPSGKATKFIGASYTPVALTGSTQGVESTVFYHATTIATVADEFSYESESAATALVDSDADITLNATGYTGASNGAVTLLPDAGDKIRIVVNAPSAGTYDIELLARSGSSGGNNTYSGGYNVEVNGVPVSDSLDIGSTQGLYSEKLGGYYVGTFRITVTLSAGNNNIDIEGNYVVTFVDKISGVKQ